MDIKQIKRNGNIKVLSHDHHFGLLFCWKIRKGIIKNIALGRIRQYINYYWTNHLRQHFGEEEIFFYALVESSLCVRGLSHHQAISDMIKIINAKIVDNPETYLALADIIDEHIRFEENELFPFMESVLSAEALAAIDAQLGNLHVTKTNDNYADEFWTNSSLDN